MIAELRYLGSELGPESVTCIAALLLPTVGLELYLYANNGNAWSILRGVDSFSNCALYPKHEAKAGLSKQNGRQDVNIVIPKDRHN